MSIPSGNHKLGRWRPDMRMLRWAAILLPILSLAAIDALRHTVFFAQLHTLPGFIATYVLLTTSVVAFSFAMFGLITRLQAQVSEQNRRLSALNAIATASAQRLHTDQVLETGLDHVTKVMNADAALICLVDMENEEHSIKCHRGFSPEVVRRVQRAKLQSDPIASEVVRTGRPVVMERVLDDPRVAEAAMREGVKSAISAPLKSEGEVNGILVVATRSERRFTPADEAFLTAIGGQLGMAIQNAVLFERSERKNRELAALVTVGKATTSSLDLDQVLSKSLDTVMEVAAADAAEVWLPDGNDLVLKSHRGADREAFAERPRFPKGEGFPGIVAQTQTMLLLHDLTSDSRFLRRKVVQAGYKTFCALPLRYQEHLVGILAVAARSPDALRTPSDARLLEAIGERLTVAIVNAELHRQVQDLATLQERERIAREMHDGMAQLLGYINTQTLAVKKLLANEHLAAAREELTKMEDIARDLYADVREGILGLRMAARQNGGLLSALREYTDRYTEMCGVAVQMDISPEVEHARLAPSVEVQLMRILQEALTNVRKHAQATIVRVALERRDGELRATVADNGQGFDMARLPSRGWPRFGLQTMRERAEAVGGTLSIHTGPGEGTRVAVAVPLLPDAA
ncbi:MAG: GAF domain-containing sensor histidine kinase [Chloroflexi bacterium]|nr:GAF domain-containing sensor histidine kinase [Chloroflexota bacterium]